MQDKPFIFDPSYDLKFVISNTDDFLKEHKNTSVTMTIFQSKENIKDIFENRKIRRYNFSYAEGNGGYGVLTLNKKDKQIKSLVIPIPNSEMFIFLNFQNLKSMRLINSFLLKFYFEFSKLSFTSKELHNLLLNLEKTTPGEVNSRKIIYKQIVRVPSEKNLKGEDEKSKIFFKKRTDMSWTNESFSKSFETAIRNNEFIDKIEFQLKREKKPILNGYLTREGIFKFNGNFSIFLNSFINVYIKSIGQNKNRFLEEHIAKRFDEGIKSFRIKFDYPIFKEIDKNKEFIDTISSMNSSMTIVHHGNPYLHLSVLDFLDGSSYDLISSIEDNLKIISKEGGTLFSISRLINYIFENFSEGDLLNE